MARAERIFRYPEHKVFRMAQLAPRHMTQEQCRIILNQCAETNSTLIIYTGQACVFFPPTEFMKVRELSRKDHEKFLAFGSRLMMLAENLSIKTPIHRFSNN